MAFSARGREESRCVHVRLGKSEVTALTHKYISLVSASRDTAEGRRGRDDEVRRRNEKGDESYFLVEGFRLIQRDEETTSKYTFLCVVSFFRPIDMTVT